MQVCECESWKDGKIKRKKEEEWTKNCWPNAFMHRQGIDKVCGLDMECNSALKL